jgi:hypothetical protein
MKQITIINQNSDEFTFYDNNNGTIIRTFEGFEYPIVRESIEDVSGEKSAVYMASYFGRRQISFTGDLLGSNVFQLRHNLLKVLDDGLKTVKIVTYDDLELQFEAQLDSISNPYTHQIHTFTIKMSIPNYRLYSQDEYDLEIHPFRIYGGIAIPAIVPFEWEGGSTEPSTITNAGNEQSEPIFTIYGPGTYFKVKNITTGEYFEIDEEIIQDDEIIIDVKNQTVTLDGSSIRSSFSGDFWKLESGDNLVRFVVLGDDENTKLKIEWRDAYLGV